MTHHEPDLGDRLVYRVSGAEGEGHAAQEEQGALGAYAAGAKGPSQQAKDRLPRGGGWKMDWAAPLEPVARELLGDPQRRTPTEWRYRGKGSLAIHVAGPRRGTWRDHEAGVGGGVLEFVEHIEGTDRAGGVEWLRRRGLLAGRGQGLRFGPSLRQADASQRYPGPRVSGQTRLPENRSVGRTRPGSSAAEIQRWRDDPTPANWQAAKEAFTPSVDLDDTMLRTANDYAIAAPAARLQKAGELVDLLDLARPLDPLDWRIEYPALDWLVPNWLPRGRAGLFTGIGGRGKSTLVLQLAAALVTGRRDWIGGVHSPQERPHLLALGQLSAVVASWEERHAEMARRTVAIAEALDLARPSDNPDEWSRLQVLDMGEHGPVWAPPSLGELPELSDTGRWLRQVCEDIGAALLVIDPLDAAYMADENDRAQVRAFMASWDRWASDTRCSVLFVAHPNKEAFGADQGEGAFSGSTPWHGASRAIWTLRYPSLKREDGDEKVLQLECIKSNCAEQPMPVWMKRTDLGVLQEREGPQEGDYDPTV